MSNINNIQNRIRSVSAELVQAREAGDQDLIDSLEDELLDLEDQLEDLFDDKNSRHDWDD